MILVEVFEHLLIVVIGSLLGSAIFAFVFIYILKHSIFSSAAQLVSDEARRKAAEWLEKVIEKGINRVLKDPAVKKIVIEILDVVKKKIEGDEKNEPVEKDCRVESLERYIKEEIKDNK